MTCENDYNSFSVAKAKASYMVSSPVKEAEIDPSTRSPVGAITVAVNLARKAMFVCKDWATMTLDTRNCSNSANRDWIKNAVAKL